MRIAVIGRGNVGSALGGRWAEAGHEVLYGVRAPEAFDERTLAAVVEDADVAVLAVPHAAVPGAVEQLGDMSGKVVLDCTNPIAWRPGGPTVEEGPSFARQLAERLPGASVFKVFNSTGAEVMRNPVFGDRASVMPYAGDDDARRADVARLVADVGFEPLDAGGLDRAPLLEGLAVLWIGLVMSGAMARSDAFAVLRS